MGKHKLAPKVSPHKTIEGVIGGIVLALCFAGLFLWGLQIPVRSWIWWGLLVFISVLFGVLGDLFESMLKRQAGIKDSGTWFPGHGGLLDRIDSICAAIPIFVLGIVLIRLFM